MWLLTRSFRTNNSNFQSQTKKLHRNSKFHKNPKFRDFGCLKYIAPLVIGFTAGCIFVATSTEEEEEFKKFLKAGQFNASLPSYTKKDLQQHKTSSDRIWVSFKEGVYDITDFIEGHPGGDKILIAAGSAVDPFWNMYQVHRTGATAELLEGYRIGNLIKDPTQVIDESDPYSGDPTRHPALKVNTQKPFNAESPLEIVGDNFITPNDLFFVRNHLPVPLVDPKDYKLEIKVEGKDPLYLSLEDLANNFPNYSIVATIQCAGNRRSEMSQAKPVRGLSWSAGAISNAEWKGPKLRDVLLYAGFPEDEIEKTIHHIHFEALDKDFEKYYGASVPVNKVMDPTSDVILAVEMNGEPIPADHGFPLRVIVPGTVGARNVKWLKKVVATKEESPSHWQQKDYKGFGPYTDWDNIDYGQVPAIQDLPIQSAITFPTAAHPVSVDSEGYLTVKGYAWSGGGRGIIRVDVSLDDGKTWEAAKIIPNGQPIHRAWAWSLWEHQFKVPEDRENVKLVVKAVDSSYNVQPENWEGIWNVRGVLSTAWHRVDVKINRDE